MEHQNIEKLSLDNTNLGTSTVIHSHFALFCFALFAVGLYATFAIGGFVYMVASQFATLSEILIVGFGTLVLISIFVWLLKTRFHLAKTMFRNRTFLRGNGDVLQYFRDGDWVTVSWEHVGPPTPVFPESLDESIYRPDQESIDIIPRSLKPSIVPSLPVYKISFSGPESDRPTVYFMSLPFYNYKTNGHRARFKARTQEG